MLDKPPRIRKKGYILRVQSYTLGLDIPQTKWGNINWLRFFPVKFWKNGMVCYNGRTSRQEKNRVRGELKKLRKKREIKLGLRGKMEPAAAWPTFSHFTTIRFSFKFVCFLPRALCISTINFFFWVPFKTVCVLLGAGLGKRVLKRNKRSVELLMLKNVSQELF